MKYKFKEAHHYERGFEGYLNGYMGLVLDQVEESRKSIVIKYIITALATIASIVIAIASIIFIRSEILVYICATLFLVIYFKLALTHGSFKAKNKEKICQGLVKYFGNFKFNAKGDVDKSVINHLDFLIPEYDIISTEDHIKGEHNGNFIESYEIGIVKGRPGAKHKEVIFKGFIITIKLQHAFNGKTFIVKNKGSILKFFKKHSDKYKKISSLNDSEFDKRFEIYASDQNEGERLVNNALKKKIVQLAENYNVKTVSCCFYEDKAVFAIPTSKNLFEPIRLFKSTYNEAGFKNFLRDFQLVLDIAEDMSEHFRYTY